MRSIDHTGTLFLELLDALANSDGSDEGDRRISAALAFLRGSIIDDRNLLSEALIELGCQERGIENLKLGIGKINELRERLENKRSQAPLEFEEEGMIDLFGGSSFAMLDPSRVTMVELAAHEANAQDLGSRGLSESNQEEPGS